MTLRAEPRRRIISASERADSGAAGRNRGCMSTICGRMGRYPGTKPYRGDRAWQPARALSIAEQEEHAVSNQTDHRSGGAALTRRDAVTMGLALAGAAAIAGSTRPADAAPGRQATPVAGTPGDHAEA